MDAPASQISNSSALEDLRAALLALEPTGASGFEGLLAVVLGAIAQQDFRLAKSGFQGGKDGAAFSSAFQVSFEGKRYDGKLNDKDVLAKITQLIGNSNPPDVWVLGATVEASTQLLGTVRVAAEKNGIKILSLDWPAASTLPPLALACAMAPEATVSFLQDHVEDAALVAAAKAALETLRTVDGFAELAAELTQTLREPSLAGANARTANRQWLEDKFADRARAKAAFGQTLAPNATWPLPTQDRQVLVEKVQTSIAAMRSGEIVALVGKEGHGKSWLFAQSWVSSAEPPLAIVIRATEINQAAPYGNILPFLISKLIEQTGDLETEVVRRRWEKQLGAWSAREDGDPPRFVVYVDGLNERPDLEWARWLDSAASVVAQHGGVLVVTAREAYFRDRIRTALLSKVELVAVPEWSDEELRAILTARGIDPGKLASAVFDRLRNPRILAIAFSLLDNVEIEAFTELTVERLLFEHIRIGAREGNASEPVDQFVKRLADHAQEIIDRIHAQQHDDRLVFEQVVGEGRRYELSADLLAVTAEHFFLPLQEDRTLYTLGDKGLSLALGLAIIKALQKAERNGWDIDQALGELLDPIAALDMTAEAAFSATLVSSIDDQCSPAIRRALLGSLLKLQNLNTDHYPAFVAVVRNMPDAALWALYDLAERDEYAAHRDWLVPALRECRHRPDCWAVIAEHVSQWLSSYSFDPTLRMIHRRNDGEAAYQEERQKKIATLSERKEGLPAAERQFLVERMVEHTTLDPSQLHRPALELLAGMPLASFSEALVACAFAMSLNPSMGSPDDEFHFLVRFNRSDWASTRTSLLEVAAFLAESTSSRTAKWALVSILRATSTTDDAEREDQLVQLLTADREKFEGWRLVEKYSASDPCDPDSVSPNNIGETVLAAEQLDIDQVRKTRFTGQQDHFLEDALPGLVRFAPAVAVRLYQAVGAALASRTTPDVWLGISSLEEHSAVLDADTVATLKALAVDYAAPREPGSQESKDRWIASQYALFLILPHLNGNEQADLLMALPQHGPTLSKLSEVFAPCAPEKAELLLDQAVRSGDKARIILALSFLAHSGTQITAPTLETVAQLLDSDDSVTRAFAMEIVANCGDRTAIQRVVEGGWSAAALDSSEHFYEVWYGSHLMVRAVELKMLDAIDLLDRISPKLYSQAAKTVGLEVQSGIAARLKRSIEVVLDTKIPFQPPAVEQEAETKGDRPPLLSLAEPNETLGVQAFFKRLSEEPEDYAARQKEGWKSFNQFEAEITKADARLAVENVGFEAIDAVVDANFDDAFNLARLILNQPDRMLPAVKNFGLMLAKSISAKAPEIARQLFDRLSDIRAYVGLTFGPSSLPLEAVCIWKSAGNPEMDALRTRRLDHALNDDDLSQEVLAAIREGQSNFIDAYAKASLASEQPATVARGLMVLGFGLPSEFADETLERHAATKGMIGKAATAARFAYDRDRWARHWFERMCATDSPEEFWCCSILFLKLVDGRFQRWGRDIPRSGEAIERFGSSIQDRMQKRISRWSSKREKTLLGDKTPSEIFTVTD